MLVIKSLLFVILVTSVVESTWSRSDPCDDYYCAHGGTCVSQSYYYGYRYKRRYDTTPTCQCAGSWKGERCDDNPCDGINCNSGTCLSDESGSPLCCCPEGCKGQTCADDDNSSCEAASGMCIANDGSCAAVNVLDIPCCNGKVCCQNDPCDGVDCNGGTCVADNTGSVSCQCPPGCTGETCTEEDSSSCEAADGMCIASDGTCPADRVLNIPCCNGNVCCRNDPCEGIDCNGGTCVVDNTGSASCLCPPGCKGDTCTEEDSSSCEAADGTCIASDGTCPAERLLNIPCCNGNVCCRNDPCEGIDCNGGTCVVDNTGSASCLCPPGCTGDTCTEEDDTECNAAYGQCVDGTCGSLPTLDVPCCNGKSCCLTPIDVITCEGNTVTLACRSGYALQILEANYGRLDFTTCSFFNNNTQTNSCSNPNSLSIAQTACDGQPSCVLGANDATFGDPCPEFYKYLRVSYWCVGT